MGQCKAKSKRSRQRCKNHAVKGKAVCRMHGAFAGPKTPEGRLRIKLANTTHGKYTREAQEAKLVFRQLTEGFRDSLLAEMQ